MHGRQLAGARQIIQEDRYKRAAKPKAVVPSTVRAKVAKALTEQTTNPAMRLDALQAVERAGPQQQQQQQAWQVMTSHNASLTPGGRKSHRA